MTGEPTLDAVLFLLSLAFATIISAAEVAVDAASRSQLEPAEQEGDRRATLVLRMKDDSEKLRGAVQIVVVILIVVAAAMVVSDAQGWILEALAPVVGTFYLPAVRAAATLFTAVLVASVILVFCTLYAKALGTHYGEALALRTARMLTMLIHVTRIPSAVLTFTANLLLRPSGGTAQFRDAAMSEEHLLDLIEESTKTGVIDQTEQELIESIFDFTDTTAREIMVPRKDVVAIDISHEPERILEQVVQEGFTRMPVYRGSLDDIVGVIYAKDVVSLIEHRDLIILADIIRPPFVVPETKPISELLREFQRRRIHLAIVVDEFGGTEGIITLEDILEEIVGEISDEYDEEQLEYTRPSEGVLDVSGMMNVTDFNEISEYALPESDEYDTIGGFITTIMGRIPEQGDACTYGPLRIDVTGVADRRIVTARFTRAPNGGEDA